MYDWVHLGVPRFEPEVQVQSFPEPAPPGRFVFSFPTAPHPKPWVRCGFSAGSGGSGTRPRPV